MLSISLGCAGTGSIRSPGPPRSAVLNNLCRKGLLAREKRGRAFYYHPQLSREEFVEQVSREVLSGVVRLGPEHAINSFVDVVAELGPQELERLKRRLAEHRRKEDGE